MLSQKLENWVKIGKKFHNSKKGSYIVKKLAPRCMSVAKRVDTGRRNSATTTSCLPHGDHKTISRVVDQHRLFTQILPNLPTPTFSDSLATAPGQLRASSAPESRGPLKILSPLRGRLISLRSWRSLSLRHHLCLRGLSAGPGASPGLEFTSRCRQAGSRLFIEV